MKKHLINFFKYIEPLWLGNDGKISVKSSLAIAFSINMMVNLSHAFWKWDSGKSLDSTVGVLGIEGGLIVALLGITAYANLKSLDAFSKTTVEQSNSNSGDVKSTVIKQEKGLPNDPVLDLKPNEEPKS